MQDESMASSQLPQSLGEFEPGFVAFDNYSIIGKVGAGGMGVVYKATNILLDRTSALKVMPVDTFSSNEVVRFQNEARLLSRLKHSNIAQVYDFGIGEGNRPYLAMEYIEGDTLQDSVDKNGPLPLDLFFDVFIQIAKGLSHAHEKGVIHRDVKTTNIMLSKDEEGSLRAVLLDFGVAKMSSDDGSGRLTRPGAIIGSPLYMSPEQIVGDSATVASDIYSLSCVMFFALVGDPPFLAETVLKTLSMHREAAFPIEKLLAVPGVSEELCEVIASGLSKSPSDRQSSASQIAEKLIELSTKLQDTVSGANSVSVPESSAMISSGRQGKVVIAVFTVVVTSALAGLFWFGSYFNKSKTEVDVPARIYSISPGAALDEIPITSIEEGPFNKEIIKKLDGGGVAKFLNGPKGSRDKVDLAEADKARISPDVSAADLQTAYENYHMVIKRRRPTEPPDEITARCLLGIYEIDLLHLKLGDLANLEKEIFKYSPDGEVATLSFVAFEKAATIYAKRQKFAEEARCHQSAARVLKKVISADTLESAKQEAVIGGSYLASHNQTKAKVWLERARIHLWKFAPFSEEHLVTIIRLGAVYGNLKDYKKSEQRFQEAEKVLIQRGVPSESAGYLYSGWASLLYSRGQIEEAKRKIHKGLSYKAEETRPAMLKLLETITKETASHSRQEVSH